MSDEHRVNQDQQNSTRKRGYLPPQLVCFGRVRDLTQSGTLNGFENSTNPFTLSCKSGNNVAKKSCVSDRRAKENILRIGDHPLGIGLYFFDYKPGFRDEWGHGRQFGVIAQEVEAVMPEAVSTHPDGYMMVDYAMLGVTRSIQ